MLAATSFQPVHEHITPLPGGFGLLWRGRRRGVVRSLPRGCGFFAARDAPQTRIVQASCLRKKPGEQGFHSLHGKT